MRTSEKTEEHKKIKLLYCEKQRNKENELVDRETKKTNLFEIKIEAFSK